jgi:acetylornithine/succinyldiaminopimelate/putrescine aminotransferase
MLLMFDEVQTGFARTGEWFAWQHHFDSASEIRPDVVAMAKALGNGVPIGAIWAKREVAAAFQPGDHATTFGGQPLATSAARAVLRVMEAIDAPSRARALGDDLMGKLLEVPNVIDTRGLGLLIAAEIDTEVVGMTGPEIALRCLDAGLVVNGISPTAIRLAPPLTVSSEEIDEAMEKLSAVLGGS